MQEAHRNRFRLLPFDLRNRRAQFGLAQGSEHGAVGRQSLSHLEAKPPRHQWCRLDIERLVEARRSDAAHLKHVAKALGCDQRGARTLLLQDRVGGDGGCVEHLVHAVSGDAGFVEHRADARDHGLGIVMRCRRHLAGQQPPVRQAQRDVGERAADVGRDACAGHRAPVLPKRSARKGARSTSVGRPSICCASRRAVTAPVVIPIWPCPKAK